MTNQQNHPITPPPELLPQLEAKWLKGNVSVGDLLTDAYRAGADQELEACCEWLREEVGSGWGLSAQLRAARRPKPSSLKEQALERLSNLESDEPGYDLGIIRRALEQLDD